MSKTLHTIIPFSFLLLILTIISFISGPKLPIRPPINKLHTNKHIQLAAESTCEGTLYPQQCISSLSNFQDLPKKTLPEIISNTIDITIKEVRDSAANCSGLKRKLIKRIDPLDYQALDDCLELFSNTVTELQKVVSDLTNTTSPEQYYDGLLTLLSGAMTNQDTCLDGFAYSKANTRKIIQGRLKRISRHFSNSLAMVKKLKKKKKGRKTMSLDNEEFPEYGKMRRGYPTWLRRSDRKLLQLPVNETKIDFTVAKDGSGNFTTINGALNAVKNNSKTRVVIYIKSGAYFEYVEVDSKKSMVMFLGDGIGKTWIKGNRSVVDNSTTFRSATVAVVGSGFLAKGISFENYAGAIKHQAVALRSSSDFSAFFRCSFVAYQDTLYTHTLRQFYRECDIYGTIDFIFGNAAVVFQKCNLYARKPLDNQQNIFTAQGREDPNQNTGISIINCKIAAGSELLPNITQFRSYLGRPWKLYSRTVYMYSKMEAVVNARGWLEWNGNFALDTLYYGEYKNRGPGSNTSGRVTWPGYRVINNSAEASQFTVANFIQGDQWLNDTGFDYYLNLTEA